VTGGPVWWGKKQGDTPALGEWARSGAFTAETPRRGDGAENR